MIRALTPFALPLPPGGEEARRELRDEMWDPVYAGTWWDRFKLWLGDALMVTSGDLDLTAVLTVGFVLVLLLIAVGLLVLWWRRRHRPTARGPEEDDALFDDVTVLTADAYRERAEEHERAERWNEAVLDRYRAVAARAVERGLVVDSPDLTAHEVSAALAGTFPGHAGAIRHAGSLFDRVRYGGGHAGRAEAESLAGLDRDLADAAPATAHSGPIAPAVPR